MKTGPEAADPAVLGLAASLPGRCRTLSVIFDVGPTRAGPETGDLLPLKDFQSWTASACCNPQNVADL